MRIKNNNDTKQYKQHILELEKNWNSNVSSIVYSISPKKNQRYSKHQPRFKHVEGTSVYLENQIVSQIISRERLWKLVSKSIESYKENYKYNQLRIQYCDNILDLFVQIRNSTVLYVQSLTKWRMSIEDFDDYNPLDPLPFMWKGYNYTMKIIQEFNFLKNEERLLLDLKFPVDKIQFNPLMLSNTLLDFDDGNEPSIKANLDIEAIRLGQMKFADNDDVIDENEIENLLKERLELRKCERILLQELQQYDNEKLYLLSIDQPESESIKLPRINESSLIKKNKSRAIVNSKKRETKRIQSQFDSLDNFDSILDQILDKDLDSCTKDATSPQESRYSNTIQADKSRDTEYDYDDDFDEVSVFRIYYFAISYMFHAIV